eukprot:contig_37554_g8835
MATSRRLAGAAVVLAVVGPLLLSATAAAAAGPGPGPAGRAAKRAGGAGWSVRAAALPDRLGVSTRFTRDMVDTCSGVVTLGPVQCPCDMSLVVYTDRLSEKLSWALQATVERDGKDMEILRMPNVTADKRIT